MNCDIIAKTGLSLDRLRNFCRVAEMESFTRAAEGDPNKQTLYSRQVKDLEQFFGTELFHRKGRTVTLSSAGKELHLLVTEYFSALEDFRERCSGELGSYTIGSGESIIQWKLIPKLNELKEAFAKADVVFKNLRTRDVVDGIKKGEIDFGIIRKSATTSELAYIPGGVLEFAFFHPSNEKVDHNREVELFSRFPLAIMEGNGRYQSFIDDLPGKHGVIIRKSVSCSSFPMMAKALTAIPIAAILPKIARYELQPRAFTMVEPKDVKALEQELCVCWNKRLAAMNPSLVRLGKAISVIMKG